MGVTTGGAQNQEWKHKLCDYKFCQKNNKGNKTWHTDTCNKKLQTIATDKAKESSGNIKFQASARYIIDKREINKRSIAHPVKGVGLSSFRRILSTISMRQWLSYLPVYHYHYIIILMLGPG